jgi:hypothetical protein
VTIRRDIDKAVSGTMATLESKLSNILNLTLTATLNWVSKCLAQQRKTDFRPRDDDLMAASSDTPACQAVCQFLTRVAAQSTAALDGRNLSLFLAELARGLRALVLAHLLKFTYSQLGGIIASKDVQRYAEIVQGWPTDDEDLEPGAMEVLIDVSQLFLIKPDGLRARLAQAQGGDVQELKAFIMRREDVGSVEVQVVLAAF